ncbi:MAG: hypothetical protein ACJ76N_21585 [Thermoanaerobaculia bacterium]
MKSKARLAVVCASVLAVLSVVTGRAADRPAPRLTLGACTDL